MENKSLFRKSIEVETYTDIEEHEIKKIIKANYNLPVHEIKKIVKRKFRQITNEDMERMICEISEARRKNVEISLGQENEKYQEKDESLDK